jgi:hypothetical protein
MGAGCLDDQPCQNFDRERCWFVLQRFPYLGFWNGDVEKVQKALQQSGSPRLQIFRRCRAREGGDGGERRRQ